MRFTYIALLHGLLVILPVALGRAEQPAAKLGDNAEPAPIVQVAERTVSLHAKDRPLGKVLRDLEGQCSRRIALNWQGLGPEPKVSVDLDRVPFLRVAAELSIASKTPIGGIGGRIGDIDRQNMTFWNFGFRCDHYLASDDLLILERYEHESSENANRQYAVLDAFGYENEVRKKAFDVYLKDSRAGRTVAKLDVKNGPYGAQWYLIPAAEVGRVDTVGGKLRAKIISPLLHATMPLEIGRQSKGEGFVVTVVKNDPTEEPSAEILLVRDDGKVDFRITDAWLLDAAGASIPRGHMAYIYDSKLKTRAKIWAKDLALARNMVVTFGMERDVEIPFEFPLPKK